ncbi:MAG TPA: hypothetical protein VHR45_03125 [Thermoanaerobaculia bacterium]|nr:hypothetical protein [Thermoanaerobaculia bacterium]
MRWTYAEGFVGSRRLHARQALAEKGVSFVLRMVVLLSTYPLWKLFYKLFPRTFTFQSRTYSYFVHEYNLTWSNERGVEIPIVQALVASHRGKRILEVGNVLSHYFAIDHEVLDKFERGWPVINQDVVAFRPAARYDLIVSISSLEHVGWDEGPRDPTKVLRAIENLRGLLAAGGQLVVTLPVGYNPDLDALLEAGAIPFCRRHCLRRRGRSVWVEAEWEEVRRAGYAATWPGASGLVIGVIER